MIKKIWCCRYCGSGHSDPGFIPCQKLLHAMGAPTKKKKVNKNKKKERKSPKSSHHKETFFCFYFPNFVFR